MPADWNNVKQVEVAKRTPFPSWVKNSGKPNYFPEHSAEREHKIPYIHPRAKGDELSPFFFSISEGPPLNKGGSRRRRRYSRRLRRNKSGRRLRRNKSGRRLRRNKSGRRLRRNKSRR